jgi:membrane protein YdbS with pleckstrin-like domain
MPKTYKSAVDLWLAAILIGVPLAILFTGVSIAFGLYLLHWHENIGRVAGFLLVGAGLGLGALIVTFTYPCRYMLGDSELTIQCGILRWIIPYCDIRHLQLSCSLWLAPALSLNRVKIVLDKNTYLISPKDRTAFVADLHARLDAEKR